MLLGVHSELQEYKLHIFIDIRTFYGFLRQATEMFELD